MAKTFNRDGRLGVGGIDQVDTQQAWPLMDDLEFSTSTGGVEAVYLMAGTGGVVQGYICTMNKGVATPTSPTADAGMPLCVAMTTLAQGEYGWFGVKGTVPLACTATTTVGGKVYMGGTAGQTTSASTVGKAILNAVFAEAVTITSGYKLALATVQHPTEEAPNA